MQECSRNHARPGPFPGSASNIIAEEVLMNTILITGASGGIGGETARLFQRRGWNVVATMRSPEKGQELAKLDNVLVTQLDVKDTASISAAIQEGIDRFGSIDVLLNNAGYGIYSPLEAIPSEAIRDQFEVNVFGYLDTIKAILPHFRKRGSGLIINVSSIGGIITFPHGTLYHGTKFAIEGLSESLSFELRDIGIGVKIIEPGDILTDFQVKTFDSSTMPEYEPLVSRFFDCYAPVKAQGSEPIVVAEVIFTAATDGVDRLRYPAGHDAVTKIQNKKDWPEARYLADMRAQFRITDTPPRLADGGRKP
jgi:NAD(P)-dependent dehydrogenase (short-subunit alcohol dehydrogenase family)